MINRLLLAAAVLIMVGCTTLPEAAQKGAEINDGAVDTAIWTLCYGASVGAIRREFGQRPDVWLTLCDDDMVLTQ